MLEPYATRATSLANNSCFCTDALQCLEVQTHDWRVHYNILLITGHLLLPPTGSAGAAFRYVPVVVVSSVQPAMGPVEGGTEVLVTGENFQNAGDLICRFGDTAVPVARWISINSIICIARGAWVEGVL